MAVLYVSTGCTSTVTPDVVQSEQASWDGAQRNSGVVRVDQELGGFVVTERFAQRYAALVAVYGDARDGLTRLPYFTPALKAGHGISKRGDEWVMTPEAMAAFLKMNAWRKAGRSPL